VAHASRQPSQVGPHRFTFLNETHSVDSAEDWNHPGWEKLWLYNLHYFDDLAACGASSRRIWHCALIARWIAENPPAVGNGWEPYPLSLRIVNWIKWSLAGNPLEPAWRDSLALQLRVLAQCLEWHLLGNHLLANAKALVFGGLFFIGHEPERWLKTGLGILAEQLPEQILVDGGHFERSPMYHAIVLEDLLDLINLTQAFGEDGDGLVSPLPAPAVSQLRTQVPRMLAWLRSMTHPDGRIGFFNDAAFGIGPCLDDLEAYAQTLGLAIHRGEPCDRVFLLDPSGYVRVVLGPAVCLFDTAPIGPDYLPGHAHADSLSFEWSLFGQRVVVNSGTSRYGTGQERLRERGTAAHSTVLIDGENSSEVWGGFRVARRARPFDRKIRDLGSSIEVSCAHDGYRRLPGKPIHRRLWRLSGSALEVVDTIEGTFTTAMARFHLHPNLLAEHSGRAGRLTMPSGKRIEWQVAGGQAALVPSSWHPEFGRSVATHCLDVRFTGGMIRTRFTWD
jgi:uncharacterized heparinase superfamily protein